MNTQKMTQSEYDLMIALEQAVIYYAKENLSDRFILEFVEADIEENTANGYYTDGQTVVEISYDANDNYFSMSEMEEDRTWSQIEASIEENEKLSKLIYIY